MHARGLDGKVTLEKRMDMPPGLLTDRWLFFRTNVPHVPHSPGMSFMPHFLGVRWYALWDILQSGVVPQQPLEGDRCQTHTFVGGSDPTFRYD